MAKIDLTNLTAQELDDLIEKAARRRASLQPEITRNHPEGELLIAQDPLWYTFLDGANTILQIRDPGRGWITAQIPPHERANLLSVLLRQALSAPQTKVPEAAVPTTSTGGGTVH